MYKINKFYKKKDMLKSLKGVGIKQGDSVFLTTNIALIGIPKTNSKNKTKQSSKWLLSCLRKLIGKKGNIFVPTYSYTFKNVKKNTFHVKNSKSKIGYFPNYFLKEKNVERNIDPMVSVAGIGPNVKNILNNISLTSYGKNCIFERLLKITNLKSVIIGLGYNWIPFIHYIDWLNKVPFRYDKYFKGYIVDKNNVKKLVKWHYPVRYLNNNSTISDGYKLGRLAYIKGMFAEKNVGRSKVLCINYKSYFKFCKNKSKKNKWITASDKKN